MLLIKILIMSIFYICRSAYVEFEDIESVENAKCLSGSLLEGRQISVSYWCYNRNS